MNHPHDNNEETSSSLQKQGERKSLKKTVSWCDDCGDNQIIMHKIQSREIYTARSDNNKNNPYSSPNPVVAAPSINKENKTDKKTVRKNNDELENHIKELEGLLQGEQIDFEEEIKNKE